MAKSQKHSNKEVRKPKTEKAAQALAPASFLDKAAAVAIGMPKRKP